MTNIQKLAAEGNKNHRIFAATVVGFRRFTVFYYLIELKIENFVVFIAQNTSRRTGISSVRERVFERHIVNAVRNVARHIQRIYEQQLSLWNKGLYILNAWVSENRFCIAQEKVEDKSNEITAIPEILSDIDISDAVVSIDAMGTQREIAELIVRSGGHYLLAVKENQRSLCEDMECAFRVKSHTDFYEEVDAGHGRIETRRCSILPARDYLMEETLESWKNLSTIVKIESIREIKDRITRDIRYYISDEKEPKASYYAALARGHWSIENQLHWHLDVTFKEDECRARKGFASQNLSVLRKIALHIVSEQKDKLSMKRRLYKAALDINYLKKLLKF